MMVGVCKGNVSASVCMCKSLRVCVCVEGADTLARVPGSPPLWSAGRKRAGTMSRIVLVAGPCVLTLPPLPALVDRCIPPCHA